MEEDTQPNTLPRPPPHRRWWDRVRHQMGTAGLVALIVAFLAGITIAASLFPGVRHGVGKVITHHGSPAVKSQLVTPSLRDGSPDLSPSSFTRSTVRPPTRAASTAPVVRRASSAPSTPVRSTPTIRSAPPVTPTVPTTTSSSAPASTVTPTPTGTVPTTPAPSPTSPAATVTTVPAVPSS